MHHAHLKLLLAATILSGSILLILAVLLGQPPTWLAKYELGLQAGMALLFGFTGYLPPVLAWLQGCRPVRGAGFLLAGALAMHLPANLVISCLLIGAGIRLIWQTACDLTEDTLPVAATSANTAIVRVRRETTPARSWHESE